VYEEERVGWVKACKHYGAALLSTLPFVWSEGDADEWSVYVAPGKYPWGGYIVIVDGDENVVVKIPGSGDKYLGFYGEYLWHLAERPECREEVGLSEEELEKLFEEVREKWLKDAKERIAAQEKRGGEGLTLAEALESSALFLIILGMAKKTVFEIMSKVLRGQQTDSEPRTEEPRTEPEAPQEVQPSSSPP